MIKVGNNVFCAPIQIKAYETNTVYGIIFTIVYFIQTADMIFKNKSPI